MGKKVRPTISVSREFADRVFPKIRARGRTISSVVEQVLADLPSVTPPPPMSAALRDRIHAKIVGGWSDFEIAFAFGVNQEQVRSCRRGRPKAIKPPELAPEPVREPDEVPSTVELGPFQTVDEVVKAHVIRVLEAVGGDASEAARVLGINRSTVRRWRDR